MGMTKQDVDTVMDGVSKMLEDTTTKMTDSFIERITALESRLKTAENRLKNAAPEGKTPSINTAPAGTPGDCNHYEF
jgi:hypothetical protein